jgi:peptidoglycan/LPS O-acetylase OafA/YrhL
MAATNPAAGTAYFGRLDAIRGVAILWVFLYHFGGAVWGWETGKWVSGWDDMPAGLSIVGPVMARLMAMGSLGVPIFFVLSGFLIHYTYSRSTDQRVSVFWFRRWGRIYPPYLVALVAFALWQGVLWKARGPGNFVTHLFLVHNFSDRYLFGINGSFWSLAHEAQFYALYPLLFLLRRKIGMMPLLYGSLAMRLGISVWMKLTPGQFADDPAFALMLPRLYFEWILGMYVADCFLQGKRAVPGGAVVAWLCVAFACFASRNRWLDLALIPAIGVAVAIWIDHIIHQRSRPLLIERPLIPLGVISYSVYLWHQPMVNEIARRIMNSPGPQSPGTPNLTVVAFLLCCLASLIVGVGSYRLFEAPSAEFVKRWSKRWIFAAPQSADLSPLAGASKSREIREDQPLPVRVPAPAGRLQGAPDAKQSI